ncbi:Sec-independent protein translocase protein TatB [Novosphingobium sp. 9]|uniref:Sec-independent protein translocase protein TatB n=1 Tax=Novosphingobium sp. 9 TaxID=2025349 RepID=UPI0021B4D937|nr:Sec-independent protein translocase protein TatB [Novosphingobium sp. 9]
MFDIGGSELLLIVIVAVVVIGPKDLPVALRVAGRWIGKMRKVSNHFRAGIDAMVREAELEDMERKWREQNEAIMKAAPQLTGTGAESAEAMQPPIAEPDPAPSLPAAAPAPTAPETATPANPAPAAPATQAAEAKPSPEPQLPLDTSQEHR